MSIMRTITISISDELEAELDRFLTTHNEVDLNAVLEAALRQYLPNPQVPARGEQRPSETRLLWAVPIDELDECAESDFSVNHDRSLAEAWFAEREHQNER
jgi:hypothetical protein